MQPEPQIAQPEQAHTPKAKKWPVIFGIAVLLAAAIALLIYFWPSLLGETTTETPLHKVNITGEGLNPATIKIKQGQSVQWENNDTKAHQIASDPHPQDNTLPGLNSQEPLQSKETYTYTFESTGTFTYHDHLNPLSLNGTVIVE